MGACWRRLPEPSARSRGGERVGSYEWRRQIPMAAERDHSASDRMSGQQEQSTRAGSDAVRRVEERHERADRTAEPRPPGGSVSAAKFLGRLAQLDLDALGTAIHAWRAAVVASGGAWFAAEESVARAIRNGRRYEEQEALLHHITDIFRRARWFVPSAPGARIRATEASGQYVATTAMLALLVADQIAPGDFELLYRPFAELIPVSELERE